MKNLKSFIRTLPRGVGIEATYAAIIASPITRDFLLRLAASEMEPVIKLKTARRGRPAYDEMAFLDVIRSAAPDETNAKNKSQVARAMIAFRTISFQTAFSIMDKLEKRGLITIVRNVPGEVKVYFNQKTSESLD